MRSGHPGTSRLRTWWSVHSNGTPHRNTTADVKGCDVPRPYVVLRIPTYGKYSNRRHLRSVFRASVLQELLDAGEADHAQTFATRRQEIIEDCRTVLNDVTSPELAEHGDLVNEALDVAADDRLAAAQSLAASIFDTVRSCVTGSSRRRSAATTSESRTRSTTAPRCLDRRDTASCTSLPSLRPTSSTSRATASSAPASPSAGGACDSGAGRRRPRRPRRWPLGRRPALPATLRGSPCGTVHGRSVCVGVVGRDAAAGSTTAPAPPAQVRYAGPRT